MNPTNFRGYAQRTCKTMHECQLCHNVITLGQEYFDGGVGRRAHVTCVQKAELASSSASDPAPAPVPTPPGYMIIGESERAGWPIQAPIATPDLNPAIRWVAKPTGVFVLEYQDPHAGWLEVPVVDQRQAQAQESQA
jgi:hypothetical protein